MKRLLPCGALLFFIIVMPTHLHAEDRSLTRDPLLDQWYITRDALIDHVDDHFEESVIHAPGSESFLSEIVKLRQCAVDFRKRPSYRFMLSSDPALAGILADIEAATTQTLALVNSEHTPAEVLRAISTLQIVMSDYMRFRIVFSERVTRYYVFLIMFFVSVCVLIIVLIAVFRVRLSSLERNEANTSKFARQIINAQESERISIARELHDTVAQDILCIKVATETMRSAIARTSPEYEAAFRDLIETETICINRIREVCAELRPPELVHLGLKAAVSGLCAAFEKATGIACSSILYGEYSLGYEEEINCYRIIQEALMNIRKHAHATSVRVWTDIVNEPQGPGKLMIRISDNGVGITRREVEEPTKNTFGLKGMQERVRILRGEMTIAAEQAGGTTLSITIPLTVRTTPGYNEENEKTRISR